MPHDYDDCRNRARTNPMTADVAALVAEIHTLSNQLREARAMARRLLKERDQERQNSEKWQEVNAKNRNFAQRLLKERDEAVAALHQERPSVSYDGRPALIVDYTPPCCAECGCAIAEHGEPLHCGHVICYDCRVAGKAAEHNCYGAR